MIALAGGQKAVLFAENSMIYMGILSRRQSGITVLERNYREGLCTLCLEELMYFVYVDVFHQIVMDSIPKRNRRILQQENGEYSCYSGLSLYEKERTLFFQRFNFKEKQFELCSLELEGEKGEPQVVWRGDGRLTEYRIGETGGEMRMVCRSEEGETQYRLKLGGMAVPVEPPGKEKRRFEEKEAGYIRQIKELEEALYWERKQKEEMKKGYESRTEEILAEQEKQIAWVQKQYQELEETARELQKVGRMWRDKYFSREGTRQPHE